MGIFVKKKSFDSRLENVPMLLVGITCAGKHVSIVSIRIDIFISLKAWRLWDMLNETLRLDNSLAYFVTEEQDTSLMSAVGDSASEPVLTHVYFLFFPSYS